MTWLTRVIKVCVLDYRHLRLSRVHNHLVRSWLNGALEDADVDLALYYQPAIHLVSLRLEEYLARREEILEGL